MTRTLHIKGRTGLFDSPSFIVSENEPLIIAFRFENELRVGRYRLIVKHGEDKRTYTLGKNEQIELSPQWLKRNAENLEFSLVFLNATETAAIKDDYQIEPLKIETLNGNFTFTAMVQEIARKQDEQAEMISLLFQKLEQYEDEGVPLVAEID